MSFTLKNEFIEKIESIMTSDLSIDEKKKKINSVVHALDIVDKRAYFELIRLYNARSVDTKCHKGDSGKFVFLEHDNMNQEFVHQLMFTSMIHYIFARYEEFDYPGRFKKHVRRFIEHTFGCNDNRHLGPIYDLMKDESGSPIDIPDLNSPDRVSDVIKDVRPSFEQWRNAYFFTTNNYEEMRTMTKALFGTQPSIESRIRCHGLFDSEKDIDEYRISNAENIDGLVYSIPVGKNVLLDPFREIREETVVYNPDDPEFEKLQRNQIIQKRIERHGMLKRIQKSERANPEEASRLQQMESILGETDKVMLDPKTSNEDYKVLLDYKNELTKSINKLVDRVAPPGMVSGRILGNTEEEVIVNERILNEIKDVME